jgi:hypothetical protein
MPLPKLRGQVSKATDPIRARRDPDLTFDLSCNPIQVRQYLFGEKFEGKFIRKLLFTPASVQPVK